MKHCDGAMASACLIALIGSGGADAHHSVAMFRMDQTVTVRGTVEKLEWTNPHLWLWVSVTDASGTISSWGMEGASPANMNRRAGWTRHSLTAGDAVTVELHPFKDGRTGGALVRVLGPGAQVLGTGVGSFTPPARDTAP